MDVTSHSESGASNSSKQSEIISSQPTANGILPHHNTGGGTELSGNLNHLPAEEAPPPPSDRPEDVDNSNASLTSSSSTNDVSCLLPARPASPDPPLQKQKDTDGSSSSSSSPPPICTPPSSSLTCPPPPPAPPPPDGCSRQSCSLPHPHHHHHQGTNQKRLSSTKSHTSFKAGAAQIEEVAGGDCCVHCLLGCLFCELLSMCSAVGSCLACGGDAAECCETLAVCGCWCCMEVAGDVACTEEACQTVLDCGILEDSSYCLEICLECCSICFPT